MNAAMTWILLVGVLAQEKPAVGSEKGQVAKFKRERLLEIYSQEAESYTIYRDSSRKEKTELRHEPVYVWTNPVRDGQDGAVFVWTCHGRVEVVGSFFSFPAIGPRKLFHEFHSLSLSMLDVSRPGSHTWNWTPEAPGIELAPIAGAPQPARSAPLRIAQMRALSRQFSASTRDDTENRWQLRLLPQPLYRYDDSDSDILDGALFAFVTSAGTDPEALLLFEARKPRSGGEPIWQFAIGRFTDLELRIRYRDKEVFVAPLIPYNLPRQDPKHRYRVFQDRDALLIEDVTR
jgi:hypothetical protein